MTSPAAARTGGLSFTVAFVAFTGLVMTAIWAVAGHGYYWPAWVWLGGLVAIAPMAVWTHVAGRPADTLRALVIHADTSLSIGIVLVIIWLLSGAQGPWILWPVLSLVVVLALHALIHFRGVPFGRTQRLEERVETLTRTRRGALDVQAAELRRIERDLHDGAQARLVALAMQLGRAEARLGDNPEAAELVKAARDEAGAAIAELRDLARGIAPPVLADRGLAAAVQSLADRSSLEVTVNADDMDGRLSPAVESAAYFVVAEALTNVAKHAGSVPTSITLMRIEDHLRIVVSDAGPGGADADGSGLQGLRARVEALDGVFSVISPRGGPTVVRAELSCGS